MIIIFLVNIFMKSILKIKYLIEKLIRKIDIIIIDTTRCGAMITYDYLIENTGKKKILLSSKKFRIN